MRDDQKTRREILAGSTLAVGGFVAGCSGGGSGAKDDEAQAAESGDPDTTEASDTNTAGADAGNSEASSGSGSDSASATGWRDAELTDVLTGESFTIAGLSGPVVLETFAVWCPVCTDQQKELGKLREQTGEKLSVVSLNVDPNEDESKVVSHATDHGFDWRYAVAPSPVTQSLIDEFTTSITVAPSAPVVVLCADGAATYLSDRGVKPADTIQATLESC